MCFDQFQMEKGIKPIYENTSIFLVAALALNFYALFSAHQLLCAVKYFVLNNNKHPADSYLNRNFDMLSL